MAKEFSYPTTEPFNFLGLDSQDYKSAKVVIFPVPYSSTTYWKSGTKEGPEAIINASRRAEHYDIESKKDFENGEIFTLASLEPSKNSPEETILRVKKVIDRLLKDKKFPLILGGEHSITLGAVQSLAEKFSNLSVLQIDAHADLPDSYEGTKYSHACVMRRIRDLNLPVTQVGIRSISGEEADYIKAQKIKTIYYGKNLPVAKIIAGLSKNVYLTIDLDGLDPSIMPAVGTPVPGGLGWQETLNLIKQVTKSKRIVGADVVELDPIPSLIAPDFLAAQLVFKIISYVI